MSYFNWANLGQGEGSIASNRLASEALAYDTDIARLSAVGQREALIAELTAAALNGVAGNVRRGSGSPEGVVTAPVGTMYQQSDGTAGEVWWAKVSGSGNTGWVNVDLTAASKIRDGTGSPEGVLTGDIGDIYTQTDGSNGEVLWFKNSGSGNTGWRLLQSGLDVANVLDFGATGNGTTDDSAAFQAAHDSLPSTGGVILVPPGTYVTTGLTISKTSVGVVCWGPPRSARFRFTNTTGTLFTITGALFRLSGFEFESPAATHTAGTIFAIQAGQGYVNDVRISGSFHNVFTLETDGAGGWGFNWVRVTGGNAMNSLFRVKGTAQTVADNHVTNLLAATNTSYADAVVVLDTYTDTFRITGGTLGGNGTIIHIRDTGTAQEPRYIHIQSVFIEDSAGTGDGVVIDAGDDIRFMGCYSALSRNAYVINDGRDILIQGCHLLSLPRSALDLNGGTRVSFLDNTVLDTSKETTVTYSSIDVAAGVSQWRVWGNRFRVRTGAAPLPLRQLTIASGASTRFSYGGNDWGVSGTDYGAAGDPAVSDASTGTNVIIGDNLPTALHRGSAAVSLTGTVAATTLQTVTIPGGAMRTRDGVRVVCGGTTAGTNGTKTLSLTIGGSAVAGIVIPAANTDAWYLTVDMFQANSLTNQVYVSLACRSPSGAEGTVSRVQSGALTLTTTSDVAVTLTGTLANTGDTIVCRSFHQEILRR